MTRSTRAAAQVAARAIEDCNQPDTDAEDVDEDSELSEEELSDEGSDYGSARKQSGKAPPAKRAKTSSGASKAQQSPAKKGSRQKKSLSLLPTMPLDVLFEVFSHLSPKDIISLSRTSRVFRDTLMTKTATTIWRTAREQFGAPECPLYMSEPQWAVLLFGSACQTCGAKNIQRADFGLLRRVCTNCKKGNLMVESKFKTRFVDVEREVLELIPYTNVGGWSQGYGRSSRFFWASDVDNMVRKLAEYQHNVHLRRRGAQKALEAFKAQQTEVVTDIRESMQERGQWCYNYASGRYQDKQAVIDQRIEAIKSKFLELGYVAGDILCIRFRRECNQATLLSDRIWERIRPLLEPTVLQSKRERLDREMNAIRTARRAIIHTSYEEYQKTLTPSQWKYLPRTIDICALDPFAQVLDAEADVVVTAVDFEDAFRQLPELLSAASAARKLEARSLLKIPTSVSQPPHGAPEPGEIVMDTAMPSSSHLDPLDLATAVFTCQEPSCHGNKAPHHLFGWDDIASHYCRLDVFSGNPYWQQQPTELAPGPPKIAFSALGSKAASAVIRAVGLDDKEAMVSDMDAKDIRLGCSLCPSQKKNGASSWTKVGYKWHEFVRHCTVKSHTPENVVIVLSPENCAQVQASEMNDPNRSKSLWTCAHCTVFFTLHKREIVVEHVKSAHGIAVPCERDDLFLFERSRSYDVFEPGYPAEPPPGPAKTIRCLQCATGKRFEQKRLFDFGGVRNHLAAKHKVNDPVVDIHYR